MSRQSRARDRATIRQFFLEHPGLCEAVLDARRGIPGAESAIARAMERAPRGPLVSVFIVGNEDALSIHARCPAAEAERVAAALRAQGHRVRIIDPRKPAPSSRGSR